MRAPDLQRSQASVKSRLTHPGLGDSEARDRHVPILRSAVARGAGEALFERAKRTRWRESSSPPVRRSRRLVASDDAIRLDLAEASRRMAEPALAVELAPLGIRSAADLLRGHLCGRRPALDWCGAATIQTDDGNWLGYQSPRDLYERVPDAGVLAAANRLRLPIERDLLGVGEGDLDGSPPSARRGDSCSTRARRRQRERAILGNLTMQGNIKAPASIAEGPSARPRREQEARRAPPGGGRREDRRPVLRRRGPRGRQGSDRLELVGLRPRPESGSSSSANLASAPPPRAKMTYPLRARQPSVVSELPCNTAFSVSRRIVAYGLRLPSLLKRRAVGKRGLPTCGPRRDE